MSMAKHRWSLYFTWQSTFTGRQICWLELTHNDQVCVWWSMCGVTMAFLFLHFIHTGRLTFNLSRYIIQPQVSNITDTALSWLQLQGKQIVVIFIRLWSMAFWFKVCVFKCACRQRNLFAKNTKFLREFVS